MKGRRSLSTIALMVSMWTVASGISTAATDTKSTVIKVKVGKVAIVIANTNTITFPEMDPDEIRQIPAIPNDVKVIVKVRTGGTDLTNLNIIADGDLRSGSDTIPVQNVVWQASGQGFRSGTLSKFTVQTAGSWKGSGVREGVFRYYLNNSWNYQKGEYRVIVTYTLTTP